MILRICYIILFIIILLMCEQSPIFFQDKYKDFNVFLELSPDRNRLTLNIDTTSPPQEQTQIIDQSFISKRPNFFFKSPAEVMQFFQEHFDCVTVSATGVTMKVSQALGRPREEFVVEIPAKRTELSEMEMIMHFIHRHSDQIAALQKERKTEFEAQRTNFREIQQNCLRNRKRGEEIIGQLQVRLREFEERMQRQILINNQQTTKNFQMELNLIQENFSKRTESDSSTPLPTIRSFQQKIGNIEKRQLKAQIQNKEAIDELRSMIVGEVDQKLKKLQRELRKDVDSKSEALRQLELKFKESDAKFQRSLRSKLEEQSKQIQISVQSKKENVQSLDFQQKFKDIEENYQKRQKKADKKTAQLREKLNIIEFQLKKQVQTKYDESNKNLKREIQQLRQELEKVSTSKSQSIAIIRNRLTETQDKLQKRYGYTEDRVKQLRQSIVKQLQKKSHQPQKKSKKQLEERQEIVKKLQHRLSQVEAKISKLHDFSSKQHLNELRSTIKKDIQSLKNQLEKTEERLKADIIDKSRKSDQSKEKTIEELRQVVKSSINKFKSNIQDKVQQIKKMEEKLKQIQLQSIKELRSKIQETNNKLQFQIAVLSQKSESYFGQKDSAINLLESRWKKLQNEFQAFISQHQERNIHLKENLLRKMERQYEEFKQDVTQNLSRKTDAIKQLELSFKQIQTKTQENSPQGIEEKFDKIRSEHQQAFDKLKDLIDSKAKYMKQLQLAIKRINQKFSSKSIIQTQESIKSLEQPYQKPIGQSQQEQLITNTLKKTLEPAVRHHPSNSHQAYFYLQNTEDNKTKIVRQGDYFNCYNFVNATEILPQKTAKYKIKIVKTEHESILLGFCTAAGLGNVDNYAHSESAYYNCWGYTYEGSKETAAKKSSVGDIIECEADLARNLLIWRNNDEMLKECEVPPQMKGKPIYLSILMYNVGDEVEVEVSV